MEPGKKGVGGEKMERERGRKVIETYRQRAGEEETAEGS